RGEYRCRRQVAAECARNGGIANARVETPRATASDFAAKFEGVRAFCPTDAVGILQQRRVVLEFLRISAPERGVYLEVHLSRSQSDVYRVTGIVREKLLSRAACFRIIQTVPLSEPCASKAEARFIDDGRRKRGCKRQRQMLR